MAVSKAHRASNDRWDAANMAYQTVKVKKKLLDDFKAACAARGDKVNTVLRQAMERYVNETPMGADDDGANDGSAAADDDDLDRSMIFDWIWHSPADKNHVVYTYLHKNFGYAETCKAAFDAIKQAEGFEQKWALIDRLIEQVQAHIDALHERG